MISIYGETLEISSPFLYSFSYNYYPSIVFQNRHISLRKKNSRIYFYYLINKNPKYFLSSLQTTSIIFHTHRDICILSITFYTIYTYNLSYTERERENIAMKMADRFNIRPGLPCGNLKCR